MSIDRILPPSEGPKPYGSGEPVKPTKPPKASLRASEQAESLRQAEAMAAKHKANAEQARPEEPLLSLSELQGLSESISEKIAQTQAQGEISRLGQSLVSARNEMKAMSQERLEATLAQSATSRTYWDGLDVVEKARAINRLKAEIGSMELQRKELIESLRERVASGEYTVSGSEILQGMIDEFF